MNVNLLPFPEKRRIFHQKLLNLILNFELLFLIFLIFLNFNLFLFEKYLKKEIEIKRIEVEKIKKELFLLRDTTNKMKELTNLTTKALSFYQDQRFGFEILNEIINTLPEGISFSAIEISYPKTDYFLISISGRAKSRETLISFKKNLEQKKDFFEIFFTPESWLKPQNLEFFLSLKIKSP